MAPASVLSRSSSDPAPSRARLLRRLADYPPPKGAESESEEY